MSYKELISTVLNPELCAGCGACSLVCPKSIIEYDRERVVPTFVASDVSCGDCNMCVEVCPGLNPDTPKQEIRIFGRQRTAEERWIGIYQQLYGGASTDKATFESSASGGSTTTLLRAAMRYFGAEYALVMGRDESEPWRSAPAIVDESGELHHYAQSTYQLAPYLSALRKLYNEHPQAKVVMSGIACHVQAIRKLQTMDTPIGEWAKKQIAFIVEIGCSSNTLPRGTQTLVTELTSVPLTEVKRLKYREGDYPGQITVSARSGQKETVPFWQAVRHFKDNKTHRCLSCGDWVSGLADISVSDGDPNIFDGSLGLNKIAKHGRIFVRTRRGTEVIRYADLVNMLDIWPVELVGLNLGLERKRNRRATYERSGKPVPHGPLPGYVDNITIRSDAEFLAIPSEKNKVLEQSGESAT